MASNNKNQDDPCDTPPNQPHTIERLLGKPLQPSTPSYQSLMPDERLGMIDDCETTAVSRNASPNTSEHKNRSNAREMKDLMCLAPA